MKSRQSSNQAGLVSFLVVSVIVTILALITLGFAHLAGRESQQALDRQLSDVARYAAESGINDATLYSNANPTTVIKNCKPSGTYFAPNGNLYGNGLVQYSCLTINPKPPELPFPLSAGKSQTFEITGVFNLSKLFFSWENQDYQGATKEVLSDPAHTAYPPHQLPQENKGPQGISPNSTGLLEVDIYAAPNSSLTNNQLNSLSRHYFLYPDNRSCSGGHICAVSYKTASTDGSFVDGFCNSSNTPTSLGLPFTSVPSRFCNAEVQDLDQNNGGAQDFYVKMTAFYQDLTIGVQATDGSGPVAIPGVVAVVDSTGEANDVLQRIEAVVRLKVQDSFAGQSMDTVCKLFRIPVSGANMYDPANPDPNADSSCSVPANISGPIF